MHREESHFSVGRATRGPVHIMQIRSPASPPILSTGTRHDGSMPGVPLTWDGLLFALPTPAIAGGSRSPGPYRVHEGFKRGRNEQNGNRHTGTHL